MPATIPISGFPNGLREDRVFVIAEIGKNFIQTEDERPVSENIENARRLVDAAAETGADAVKFQTHRVDDEQLPIPVTSPHFPGADRRAWVERNTRATPGPFWDAVREHCARRGILFFSTPMSRGAARELNAMDVPLWKVGSADVQDRVLMDFLVSTRKPVIISTGMVGWAELEILVKRLLRAGTPLAILYCVSRYPCPPEQFNLAAISRLRATWPACPIGFSDHSLGSDVAAAAVASGARIVEKHFSMGRDLWGPDHKVSLTPPEFAELVRRVRAAVAAPSASSPFHGSPGAELEGATNSFRPIFGKALVAARDLRAGDVLGADDVFAMRPAALSAGLPAADLDRVLGARARTALKRYDPLNDTSVHLLPSGAPGG